MNQLMPSLRRTFCLMRQFFFILYGVSECLVTNGINAIQPCALTVDVETSHHSPPLLNVLTKVLGLVSSVDSAATQMMNNMMNVVVGIPLDPHPADGSTCRALLPRSLART